MFEELMKKHPEAAKIINDLLAQGKKIAFGEYRLCEFGERGFMNAATGQKASFSGVWHTVELGNKSLLITDRTEGLDVATYKTPFRKGEMVVVEFEATGYVKGKGERHAGFVHRLEPVKKI